MIARMRERSESRTPTRPHEVKQYLAEDDE
jgi:hypothetical protein